jgi:hypothetical protein
MKTIPCVIFICSTLLLFSCKDKVEPIIQGNPNSTDTLTKINALPITLIGLDSALSGVEIINEKNVSISSFGICWDTNPLPTIKNKKITQNNYVGIFATSIIKLLPGTAYYIRAYAITPAGVVYSAQRTFATDTVIYGNLHRGGRLFHVFQPGEVGFVEDEFHGLVASDYTNLKRYVWSTIDTLLNARDSVSIPSNANANSIIAALGKGKYAANVCDSLVSRGYSDWYLPNLKEVNFYRTKISGVAIWCSTEFDKSKAYISSSNPNTRVQLKSKEYPIVAVRKF